MSQTFTTSISGKVVSTPFVIANQRTQEPTTIVLPANNNPVPISQYQQFDQGVPSQHQYYGQLEPSAVSQGTDAIFNAWLYYGGERVTDEKWDITVILKPNEYTTCYLWQGSLDNGVYKIQGETDDLDFYQIWIPASDIDTLLAGTYFFDIVVQEKVGEHIGLKPRRVVLGTFGFYIYYSPSSPNPESASVPDTRRATGIKTTPAPTDISSK